MKLNGNYRVHDCQNRVTGAARSRVTFTLTFNDDKFEYSSVGLFVGGKT
jgi:hypothetical protein